MPNLEKATDKQISTLLMFMDSNKVEFKKSINISDINNFEAKILIRFLSKYLQVPQKNIAKYSQRAKASKKVIDNYTNIIIKYLCYKQEKDIPDDRDITYSQLSFLEKRLEKYEMKLIHNTIDLTSTEISYIINALNGHCPFKEVKQYYLTEK